MSKAFGYNLLALILSFSLLVPSLKVLMEFNADIVIVIEKGEEDKGKTDTEKELEKEELFLAFHKEDFSSLTNQKDIENKYYIFKNQEKNGDVTLQPPEFPALRFS